MKRQARPFVVETKRSRKAPTNLWASTPLLQQELAAASAPEPRAQAVFADRSKDAAAEPARRILQSLVVEAPLPVDTALDSEEAEEPAAPRRRANRPADDSITEPARRGRPRRAVLADDEASATATPRAPKTPEAGARSRKLAVPKTREAKPAPVQAATAKAPSPRLAPEPAAPSTAPARIQETEGAAGPRGNRARAARNPAIAALLPGERWKRRLPQRLW